MDNAQHKQQVNEYIALVFSDYETFVYTKLRTHGVPEKDLEDAAGDIFERYYHYILPLPIEEIMKIRVGGYLNTMVKYYTIDKYQRKKIHKNTTSLTASGDDCAIEDHSLSTESLYSLQEIRTYLLHAIHQLPETSLRLIMKQILNDKKLVDIARETDTQLATVRYRYHKALKILASMPEIRRLYEDHYPPTQKKRTWR